ncbi:hypothetical protein AB0I52_02345 [Streptomyces sp. NPDC050423]|uniref:DsbA family protein n=1 Tax=Streptomyces sp. NPDC050423 TaxID=3155402 RepID=UPI003418D3B8
MKQDSVQVTGGETALRGAIDAGRVIPGPRRMKGGEAQLGALPGQVGSFDLYRARVRDPGDMEIEILVVPDCPHQRLAEERLRQALDAAGLAGTGFTTRVVGDQAEAERSGFTGSPTMLIDGRDPFAEPGALPSLACRMYRTPSGLSGVPEVGQLRKALRAAADTGGGVQAR